ncbi:hypothetical protein M9H77_30574 [Catharanthus roseus]|uniref:Uncharacterized protein n=1 Tax=Catharanthus roseus TaxID=4058 RepID=A0ACC0A092_CATRO|nr:hypothetical protein M9H77_30574 [Catharanthus roseus]
MCFMAMENEVQSSPSNSSSPIDDICDDHPRTMLIEMYENKKLCEKISSLEKCLVDHEVLKKKEKKILKNFSVHKDLPMIRMALDTTTLMLLQSKHILSKLLHLSPILVVLIVVKVVIRPLDALSKEKLKWELKLFGE